MKVFQLSHGLRKWHTSRSQPHSEVQLHIGCNTSQTSTDTIFKNGTLSDLIFVKLSTTKATSTTTRTHQLSPTSSTNIRPQPLQPLFTDKHSRPPKLSKSKGLCTTNSSSFATTFNPKGPKSTAWHSLWAAWLQMRITQLATQFRTPHTKFCHKTEVIQKGQLKTKCFASTATNIITNRRIVDIEYETTHLVAALLAQPITRK